MDRNLFSRVEVVFPIEDPIVFKRIMEDLHNYLKDNVNAWELDAKGTWRAITPGEGEAAFSALRLFIDQNYQKS